MTDCPHCHGKFFIPLYFMMPLGFSLVIVASFPTCPNVCALFVLFMFTGGSMFATIQKKWKYLFLGGRKTNKDP